MSAIAHIMQCLHRHNDGVNKARPCREGDQAAIRRRVTGCQQQENAERDIKAKHHRQRRLLPDKHYQGINASRKQQPHQNQHNLQRPFSTHSAPCQKLK